MPLQPVTSFAPLAAWLKARRTRLLALFACVLVPLFLFGELAENIRKNESFAFDEAILRFMQHRANATLDQLMLLASEIGSGPVVGIVDLVVWLLLLVRRRWFDALFWALATGGAALLNQLAKHGYERTRPDLWPSIAPETSFSFPSGHTMQSTALAVALLVLLWPTAARLPAVVGGVLFALLVGISRVYLGVHYPSDVLAGWAASIAWVAGLSFLFYRHAFRPGPSTPRTKDSSILARPPSRSGESPPP
jgi:membrane-associated phospholipid phosphatase